MEAMGWLKLPPKVRGPRGKEEVRVGAGTNQEPELVGLVGDSAPIGLEAVRGRQAIRLWNEYVERYHPLGYKRPFGAHQRYFIVDGSGRRLGGFLFAASAWALAERDQWIGWTPRERAQRLKRVVNNTRFLIFPWVRVRHLASKVLSLAARRIGNDWGQRNGYRPVLLETFVEAERHRGTCYRAANWSWLGVTTGRGRMGRHTRYLSTPKTIFVYPLAADFRAHVCAGRGKEYR